ncbi:hypothetical protein [Fodinicola acaciae]|uniref:TPR repeat region-containing protein n=1 Tax=Fodinicola acaciae TaxID=2681555 RepID=UPI0013D1C9DF|nr:hypothetical protein [Fodinicola acaciae]
MVVQPSIPDTAADPFELWGTASAFAQTAGAVVGHGNDVDTAITSAAANFSDFVAPGLKKLAADNLAAFQSVFARLSLAHDVTYSWGTEVQRFKDLQQGLWSEWYAQAGHGFGVPSPHLTGAAEQDRKANAAYDRNLASAQASVAADISRRAAKNHDDLVAAANGFAGILGRDPSDADLRQLAALGGLSWATYIGYNKFGDPAVPPPLGRGDAEQAAAIIRRGPSDPGYAQAIRLVNAVNANAAWALKNNKHIAGGDLDFLHTLWEGLGPNLAALSGLPKHDQAVLGASLLNLSNEKLTADPETAGDPVTHGGFDQLPPEIRSLVTGPAVTAVDWSSDTDSSYSSGTYYQINRWPEFKGLADILGATDPSVEGGRVFSYHLINRTTEIVTALNEHGDDVHGFLDGDDGVVDLQNILGAATRNHQADYDIIAAPNADQTLRSLTTLDWKDDGRAAAGLVDWIGTDSEKANQEHRADPLADAAAARLIEISTAGDINDPNSAVRTIFNGTKTNPAFAAAFGHVAETHLAAFSDPAPDGEVTTADHGLSIAANDRLRFLGFVATDKNALDHYGYTVGQYEKGLSDAAARGDISEGQYNYRRNILNNGYLGAIQEAHDAKLLTDEQAYQERDSQSKAISVGIKAANSVVQFIPGVGPILASGTDITSDQLQDAVKGENPADHYEAEKDPPIPRDQGGAVYTRVEEYVNSGLKVDPAHPTANSVDPALLPPDLIERGPDGTYHVKDHLSSADRARLLDAYAKLPNNGRPDAPRLDYDPPAPPNK